MTFISKQILTKQKKALVFKITQKEIEQSSLTYEDFLNPKETKTWQRLSDKPFRQAQWLRGRIVAKEATLHWLTLKHHKIIHRHGIQINRDQLGRPFVSYPALEKRGPNPNISISHCGPKTVCAISLTEESIGIDYESTSLRKMNHWMIKAFTENEIKILGSNTHKALLTLWTVKEAASKCYGTGLQGNWQNWTLTQYNETLRYAIITNKNQNFHTNIFRYGDDIYSISSIQPTLL